MLDVKYVLVLVYFVAVIEVPLKVLGCRPEVCRKRRAASQERDVLLELHGCTGKTKPWVAQLAYCVNQSTFEVASEMKNWYARTYQQCTANCADVKARTENREDIASCTDCFVTKAQEIERRFPSVNSSDINQCVTNFVDPSLSDALPTFSTTSQNSAQASGRVNLPEHRPADDWYSLTVRLPCKPPVFQYYSANCINSFADDARSRDFVLAQNKLITDDGITFLVKFSDTCRFNVSDIMIVWDKSTPGFAYPQLSAFPSSNPPTQPDKGNLFFDSDAYKKFQRTVGKDVEGKIQNSRRKRETKYSPLSAPKLGIEMPCKINKFLVYDRFGNRIVTRNKGTRFVLEPTILMKSGKNTKRQFIQNYNSINFTLDFGYEETGCIFSANEARVVVSPSDEWLDAGERVICHTCQNAESEAECMEEVLCRKGDICQSEVRQVNVNPHKVSITKSCKWAGACENNWKNNYRQQCNPGKQGSVCRCCCGFNRCNGDAYQCT